MGRHCAIQSALKLFASQIKAGINKKCEQSLCYSTPETFLFSNMRSFLCKCLWKRYWVTLALYFSWRPWRCQCVHKVWQRSRSSSLKRSFPHTTARAEDWKSWTGDVFTSSLIMLYVSTALQRRLEFWHSFHQLVTKSTRWRMTPFHRFYSFMSLYASTAASAQRDVCTLDVLHARS